MASAAVTRQRRLAKVAASGLTRAKGIIDAGSTSLESLTKDCPLDTVRPGQAERACRLIAKAERLMARANELLEESDRLLGGPQV